MGNFQFRGHEARFSKLGRGGTRFSFEEIRAFFWARSGLIDLGCCSGPFCAFQWPSPHAPRRSFVFASRSMIFPLGSSQ